VALIDLIGELRVARGYPQPADQHTISDSASVSWTPGENGAPACRESAGALGHNPAYAARRVTVLLRIRQLTAALSFEAPTVDRSCGDRPRPSW
jgi:hypothetical protein